MKLAAKSILWLLPLLLTACIHWPKRQQAHPLAPPLGETTLAKPEVASVLLPDSALTIPYEPTAPSIPAKEAPKPPVKHRRFAAKPAPVQQAANPAPANPGVSAIGELSLGDAPDLRRQALDSIAATERGLNGLGRKLNDQEQKTAKQIREFLKQARQALSSGDADGAYTLAAKAKVLLGELQR
jgi:hypothetical protein